MPLVENDIMSMSEFALELQAEGLKVDYEDISLVLGPLGIAHKKMSNGNAKGVDGKDRDRIRRFFRKGVKALN